MGESLSEEVVQAHVANQDPYFQMRCQQILTDMVYLRYLC